MNIKLTQDFHVMTWINIKEATTPRSRKLLDNKIQKTDIMID